MTRGASGELHGIQMLRALAASAVVLHHSLEESNGALGRFSPDWLTTAGASGVDIFFVISGFIMLHIGFGARGVLSPGRFLLRRTTRIYPLYWLCCLGALGLMAAGFLVHHRLGAGEVASSLLLLPSRHVLVGVSWTLVYEMYFYLIFSATLVLGSRLASAAATSAAVLLLGQLASLLPAGAYRDFLANPIALEFCFGLWVAFAFEPGASGARGRRWLTVAGLGLLVAAACVVAHPNTNGLVGPARVAAWGLPACLVVFGALGVGRPQGRAGRFLVLLGDASYALYLTHLFVMLAYAALLKRTPLGRVDQMAVVPIVFAVAVGAGLLAHLMLERPLIGLARRLTAPGARIRVAVPTVGGPAV